MIAGFMMVIVMALAFLYLSQFYDQSGQTSPDNFMAGSKAGAEGQ